MSEEVAVKKYAIVNAGAVLSTIYTEEGFMEMLSANSVIDITNEPSAADICDGYTYENGVFSAPVEAPTE
jgi:hypothetical protein